MTDPGEIQVEFYFDFSSPYSYLTSTRIEEICTHRGATLEWKPILLGPVMKVHGKLPLMERPGEGEYARLDLRRWAAHLGVPFTFPERFPARSLTAARGFPFAHQAGVGGPYCRRVFEACWGQGRDIGETQVLESVAADLGLDPERFLQSVTRPEVKEWLRAQTEEATRRGVFGVPTFFVGQEMFHGNDRLFLVEEALAGLRSQAAAAPSTSFSRWFGLRCVSRGEGRAEYELEVTSLLLNRRGVAHGGVASSVLDTALGAAIVSGIASEEWCATLELSIQFREPVRRGRILGRGRMVKRGRHAAFAEGEILDSSGRVLAAAQGTWYIWPGRPPA